MLLLKWLKTSTERGNQHAQAIPFMGWFERVYKMEEKAARSGLCYIKF